MVAFTSSDEGLVEECSMLVINPDGAAPQLAVSPDFTEGRRKADSTILQPMLPDEFSTPPLRAAPPMLRRQNASRFSWPPDAQQEWCYIALSPEELVNQAGRILGLALTVQQVCEFFRTKADESHAYHAYATRWQAQLDEASDARLSNSVLR